VSVACLGQKVRVYKVKLPYSHWKQSCKGGQEIITNKYAVTPAYQAIVLPLDQRHFEALCLRRGPRLRKNIDDGRDRVRSQAHRPRKVRDGVVLDDVAEVTLALHRVPGNAACREFARAGAHGNGVRGMPYVRDVVCRGL
jgi:hypothetical protein